MGGQNMGLLKALQKKAVLFERRKVIKTLTTSSPEDIVQYGEKLLLAAFRRAATRVPAYKNILQKHHLDPEMIRDVASFRDQVPILTKEDVFPLYDIDDLCLDRNFSLIKSAMSSSGFSGIFSFGINTEANFRNAVKAIDTALDLIFDISRKKTFFINSLPMGVRIPTSLPIADTSVRFDMALAIYKKFSKKFDQVIVLSDPHFLKKFLEDGIEQGIDWHIENIHLITGEDWVPETFRSYLGHLLGTDWDRMDRGMIGGTMGVAELDLNLFHESKDLIRIQRAALQDEKLRYALYGQGVTISPTLLHYYPHRTFLELVDSNDGKPELVVSMLSDSLLIPLIRYNVKDVAQLIPYRQLQQILEDSGYGALCPQLKLPLVAIGGRKGRMVENSAGQAVSPEEVKQGLYSDFTAAAATTGYFKLRVEGGGILVEIQLKKGVADSPELQDRFHRAIATFVSAECKVLLYEYQKFPYAMELDYERKFKNI